MVSVGVFGLLLAAVTFYIGYQAAYTVPGRGYYNLHATFDNAENLANHYEIRQGGVRVGQILNPRVKDGKAVVDMRIDDKYKPLLSDTQLRIRLRSAVGVRYLEIIPGKHGTPLPEGATIPAANARTPVALDKVLGTFDAPTRDRTRELLNQMGVGTLSRGPDVNETLHEMPGLLASLRSVSDAITARPGAMSRFVAASDQAAITFDPVRDTIAQGFDPERRALAPFADARDAVQATLSTAGPALATLRSSLPQVSGLLGEVGRLARQGRPTLTAAPASLRATARLVSDAAKPLGDTKKTLELASDAVSPTLGLLAKVNPVLPSLEQSLGDVIPTLDYLAPRACDMTQFATGWAEYLKWGDSYNSFIRFMLPALRGDQPGMQTDKFNLDAFNNPDSYPAPCVNGVGVTGWEQPTVQESQRGETYSADNLPGKG